MSECGDICVCDNVKLEFGLLKELPMIVLRKDIRDFVETYVDLPDEAMVELDKDSPPVFITDENGNIEGLTYD